MNARLAKKVARGGRYTKAQRAAARLLLERRPKWRPRIWFSVCSYLSMLYSIDAAPSPYEVPLTQIIENNSLKTAIVPEDRQFVCILETSRR